MGGLELPVLRREPVDLDDVLLRAASVLRADGGLQVDTAGVAAVKVVGDAGQLGRALANLADNAARHAAGRVTFTLAEHGEVAVVTVADDGDGIPPDHQARIFERFTRLDEAR